MVYPSRTLTEAALPAAATSMTHHPIREAGLSLPAALLACVVPTMLAYNQPPSSTLLNQCVAVALWGGVVMTLPMRGAGRGLWASIAALLGALAIVGGEALASWALGALPMSLALQAVGLLAGAALLVASGANAARGPGGPVAFGALALGLLVAGLAGSAVALLQVFAPQWTDGSWIAHSGLAGRAVGNLRQPNHLCSLLLWAMVAAVALHELRWLPRAALWAVATLMVWAVELTASRTGAVGLGLLLGWALLDRRLSRSARWLLAATPLLYALAYGAMAWYGRISAQTLGASARQLAEGAAAVESPNSRMNIWHNTIDLIAAQPWAGVGFGEFNLAWSLSAFPNRPIAFFDHCHNLLLQLAVELGLPAAATVTVLLLLALWQGLLRARSATGDAAVVASAGLMLVITVALHSLVEYPLWYAYFLLPAALAWGFVLGVPAAATAASPALPTAGRWGLAAGALMTLAGAASMLDYQQVVAIYAPAEGSASLAERIEQGQRSPLFAHHADYAAATNPGSLASTALGFARAPHSLLDTRLMMTWAERLADQGQVDHARWLAQRLREFRNADSQTFFAPCKNGDSTAFQCQTPQTVHGWREFAAMRPLLQAMRDQPASLPLAPSASQ
jgi:hypothetical protein